VLASEFWIARCFQKDGMMQNFDGFDAMWIGLNTIPQHIRWTDRNPISVQWVSTLVHDENQLIAGHFNAQIDCTTDGMGLEKHTDGNWCRLLKLCAANGLKVGGSLFWHKNIHKSGCPLFFNLDFSWLFRDQKMKIHDLGTTLYFQVKRYTTYKCIPELVVTVPVRIGQ